ncbi:hypothetical protein EXE57_05735 [Nocardioides euryhalodurans]|uniref:Uncharacterized protein n=1 Tax=Nocardioides euryhalodurans TaxID=2518370 RepID=A0A4P7GIM7_9ACTN|nr:hypothetical protein EXE57_05735 [Nocardioides euryhalodurans]
MMLPPDDVEREPYDVPRGACPACGSDDVTHLVIGLPSGPEAMEGDPDWVHWVGCVHAGFDRECGSCGATWSTRPVSACVLDEIATRSGPRPPAVAYKRAGER